MVEQSLKTASRRWQPG